MVPSGIRGRQSNRRWAELDLSTLIIVTLIHPVLRCNAPGDEGFRVPVVTGGCWWLQAKKTPQKFIDVTEFAAVSPFCTWLIVEC